MNTPLGARHRTFYVTLWRRWKPRKKQWETVFSASADYPHIAYDGTIARFEVTHCATASAAPAIVAEWLYRHRPASMAVKEITS